MTISKRFIEHFVRACSVYNLSGAATFLIPGVLPMLGVTPPLVFWLWLPSLFAIFAAVVLWISARNLDLYASFPYWNGIIRLTFVLLTFILDFGTSIGVFITWLAIGDLILSVGTIFGIAHVTNKSHWQLLTGR